MCFLELDENINTVDPGQAGNGKKVTKSNLAAPLKLTN